MFYCKIILTFFLFFFITLIKPVQGMDKQNENVQRSRDVVQELHKSLFNELSAGIKEGGIEKAIDVCHKAAQKIKPPCLNCHGKKEKLSPAVLKVLKVKYPEDKAFGYRNGDLRGAFSVIIKQ